MPAMRKLAKGLTTGVGVFASTFVGNTIEEQFDLGGNGVGVAQMAIGAGTALASERAAGALGQRVTQAQGNESLVEVGIEHVGYGIHGAGFAEVADNLRGVGGEAQTGASADRVVTVNARAQGNSPSNGQMRQAPQREQAAATQGFSLDSG